jgi:hypothetical protein
LISKTIYEADLLLSAMVLTTRMDDHDVSMMIIGLRKLEMSRLSLMDNCRIFRLVPVKDSINAIENECSDGEEFFR